MAPRLHDLAGADPDLRFTPYCWRIRMVIAHKGFDVETPPWRFTDKQDIAFSRPEGIEHRYGVNSATVLEAARTRE